MNTFVWVDGWQQQCCGDDFRVGSEVRWPVKRTGASTHITELLGRDRASRVQFAADHHGESDDVLAGVVVEIEVVTCRRTLDTVRLLGLDAEVMVSVPGTGRLQRVDVADPWEPETPWNPDVPSFDGWIVGLTW